MLGAGQAAVQLAMTLRQKNYGGPIALIGDEPYPPYSRPPLSKTFLKGKTETDELFVRQRSWFEANSIDLRLGSPVGAVELATKTVRTTDGHVAYDKLILATGARPRMLPSLPPQYANVVYLRGIDDVRKAMYHTPGCRRVMVVGGGFVGLEFAAVAQDMGCAVTLVEAGPRLMERAVSPPVSDWFLDLHRRNGVDVRLETQLVEVTFGDNRIASATLSDDTEIVADLFVVGIGVLPNDALAREAGLAAGNGIIVNAMLQTSNPNVFAIGDCCNFPIFGGRRVRLESVQNAVDQAKHLAASLTGNPAPYRMVPWFWSDQYDAKLQIAGLQPEKLRRTGDKHLAENCFSLETYGCSGLECVESINDPRGHLAARKALKSVWN